MPTVAAPALRTMAVTIFQSLGASDANARTVADALVLANLLGHDSHGIQQAVRYAANARLGTLHPSVEPVVAQRFGATATVDAGFGFGQPAAALAVRTVLDLTDEFGIGICAIARTTHVGRLGEWVERIAGDGQIGLAIAAGAMKGGAVAPYGGRERIFGTNPIAIGIPNEGRSPLTVDFATSAIAASKVDLAIAQGGTVPPGALIDRDGRPTTDPNAFPAGGALLPFGDHKGYGLMIAIEVLANLLSGFAPASSPDWHIGNPTVVLAIAPDRFVERERFRDLTDALLQKVSQSAPAEGFDHVLLPGELEARTRAIREQEGIPVPDSTWESLQALVAEAS